MAVLPSYQLAAIIYSIVCLAVVVPVLFFFRHYFRGLDFLQMSYYFGLIMATTSFSTNLYTSVVAFNYNFLTFCTSGDVVCTLGFQLSFGVVLVGIILFFLISILFMKCCGKATSFQPVFLSIKGFIKWIYVPLAVNSTGFLVRYIVNSNTSNIAAPAVILGILTLYPLIQLIYQKVIQQQKTPIWRKWLQFFNYVRLLSVSVLLGLALSYNDAYYCHFIQIPLILYSFIYLWKGQFSYPVIQRIIFGAGEAAFLAVFYLFRYDGSDLTNYDLDFFLLGFVIAIDLLLYFVRSILLGLYGPTKQLAQVNPEPTIDSKQPAIVEKKVNKYETPSQQQIEPEFKSPPVVKTQNTKPSPAPAPKRK